MSYCIAMYLRISKEDANMEDKSESNSISNQRIIIENFIKNHPELKKSEIITFQDDGFSGTNFSRPSIQKVFELAEKKEIQCLIIKDFSRLGRNDIEVMDYIDQIFPKWNLRLISVNDFYDSNQHIGQTASMSVTFRQLLNSLSSKDLSKKVKSAKKAKAQKGEYQGSFTPFGYERSKEIKNKLVIEPITAEIVRDIFSMALKGKTSSEIARTLNHEGVKSPSSFKIQVYSNMWNTVKVNDEVLWDSSGIRRILTNDVYIGTVSYNKRTCIKVGSKLTKANDVEHWTKVENMHQPLVSLEDFAFIQEKFTKSSKKKRSTRKVYLFTGKIRCGVCKYSMDRRTDTKDKSYYYYCTKPTDIHKDGIKPKNMRGEQLENVVLESLKMYLKVTGEKLIIKTSEISDTTGFSKEKNLFLKGIQDYKLKKKRLYEEYMAETISLEYYTAQSVEFESVIGDLENKIESLDEKIKNISDSNKVTRELHGSMTLEEYLECTALTREIVETFVDCIYIFPDNKVKIDWKFDEIV